ncbi:MAG: hypothetical protein SFT93_04260 [Rickettsiaceae bacterium]|nr:hypothetical protein [Rickettsiaceae bacterium]
MKNMKSKFKPSKVKYISSKLSLFLTFILLSACARDLSHSTYTSSSTVNIVLPGVVLATRSVQIKEHDSAYDNTAGTAVGAIAGGASAARSSRAKTAPVIGAAILGGIAGNVIEGALGTSKGIEYIVKVDTTKLNNKYYDGSSLMRKSIAAVKASGMITIVQSENKKESPILEGQKVLIVISENRVRIIPNNL